MFSGCISVVIDGSPFDEKMNIPVYGDLKVE
jgi:hypothetical protein